MRRRTKAYLIVLFAVWTRVSSAAQEVRILLRPLEDKTSFHLGEPIMLEAACVDTATKRYLLPCSVVLKAETVSMGSRLSADRIDQTTWLDAQSGNLPPGPLGGCGSIDNQLPSQYSDSPIWQGVKLKEPFPVYVGQYKVRALLAFDLEMAGRFGDPAKHSSSDEIQISLDDNLDWENHLLHFSRCDYDVRLTLVPNSDAVAALRKHLGECAVRDDESLAMLLHEIVWLKMQVEQPGLYSRMLELERSRPVLRGEDEAALQDQELEQARLSSTSDTKQIRHWFHDQYRSLLLETGRSLVAAYKSYDKSHPELHNDGFHADETNDFDDWYDVAASLPDGAGAYITRSELADFLRQAGASQKYISAFLREHKANLPLRFPEYHQ